jgi:methionine-rich copper-binding protein CopC
MARRRLTLLGLLMTLVVSLTVSATASAHEFLIEEKPIEKTEVFITAPEGKIETTIAGTAVNIECEEGLSNGNLEGKGTFSGEIKLDQCALGEDNKSEEALTSCMVNPVEFKIKGELVGGADGGVEGEIKAGGTEKETIAEITVASNKSLEEEESEKLTCALSGTYKLKGPGIVCALPEIAIAMPDHEFNCTSSDDKIKLGEKEAARLTVPFSISLQSGEEWYAT